MLSMETEELRKQIEDPNNNIMELTHNSELNSPIPVHLSPLIPRMSTFTLVISCLTTSNLSWFMDLTFQVCDLTVCNSVDLEKLIHEGIFKSIVLPQLGDYE